MKKKTETLIELKMTVKTQEYTIKELTSQIKQLLFTNTELDMNVKGLKYALDDLDEKLHNERRMNHDLRRELGTNENQLNSQIGQINNLEYIYCYLNKMIYIFLETKKKNFSAQSWKILLGKLRISL